MPHICIITPHHVSFQPRALREADTLHEMGHDVRVVCSHSDPVMTASDLRLASNRGWRLQAVDLRKDGPKKGLWFVEGVRSKLLGGLFTAGLKTVNVASRAYIRGLSLLTEVALSEPADWFIAHTQPALPIAAEGARHYRARLGFDCEDLLAENGTDPTDIVNLLERTYLSKCDYVTAASEGIAQRLSQNYEVPRPTVLYNVFPRSLATSMVSPSKRTTGAKVRLHWFGQTIGPRRGIEEAIKAAGLLGPSVELHVRGRLSGEYRAALNSLARSVGATLIFHPLVDHEQLIASLGDFDVGLATEQLERVNCALTASNKLFAYLLAGLAIAASDTRGQREVLNSVPGVGFIYSSGDASALAQGLAIWVQDRGILRRAQQSAWDAARSRFCWDIEKSKLLAQMGLVHTTSVSTTVVS